MKISIIVAAYNAEDYLYEAMETALNQTMDDYEVIVVNDGSTDSTPEILHRLSKEYSHLKIVNKENGGPSSARNLGLDEAQGEYIYFVDSDDFIEADALESFYHRAIETKADLVIANYDIINKDSVTKINNLNDILELDDIDRYDKVILWTFSLWNKLFKKEIIDEYNLRFAEHISYSEDGMFTMNYVFRARKIAGLDQVVYHYRRMYDGSGNSITATVNTKKIKMYLEAHEAIEQAAIDSFRRDGRKDEDGYLDEIYRKEAQILFNQFYRNLWELDDEAVDLIMDGIQKKMAKLPMTSFANLVTDNNETPVLKLSKDRKEILDQAVSAAAIYGEPGEEKEFLFSLRSVIMQSLVGLKIFIPMSMMPAAAAAGYDHINVIAIEAGDKSTFYNKALEEAHTRFIVFGEAGFSYSVGAFKHMFKYMRRGHADMISQTVFYRSYGNQLPVYLSNLAFSSTTNGTKQTEELCLDYMLANKFFRTEFLKEYDIVFPEDPREILETIYDIAYWSFLNDKLVFFDREEKEFLRYIGNEETRRYVEDYYEEKPVDLTDESMGYDSKMNQTKIIKYPEKDHMQWLFRKTLGLFRRLKVKDRVLFLSIRSNDRLTGNLKELYPYVKGKKAVYAKTIPHNILSELRMIYYFTTSKVIVTDDYVRYARWIALKKDQRFIQLWHACGAFKMFGRHGTNITVREDRATHGQYSLVSVSGPTVRTIYADAFDIRLDRVASLGVPRTDLFFDEQFVEDTKKRVYERFPYLKDKEIILYAPTFRDVGGDRSQFTPDLDFDRLSRELNPDQIFVICPHPIMENAIIPHPYDNIKVIREVPTSDMMFVSDMLITDYSSVIFEYALLKKPIAFYCYDLIMYNRGFFLQYPDDLPGDIYKTQPELIDFIKNPKKETDDRKYQEFVRRYMAGCDGHSRERIAAVINSYMGVD